MNVKGIESLKAIWECNLNDIVVAYLNANLICRIEKLMETIDILIILEAKFDSSFLTDQFFF